MNNLIGTVIILLSGGLIARVWWVTDWSVALLFLLVSIQLWAVMRAIVPTAPTDADMTSRLASVDRIRRAAADARSRINHQGPVH